VAERKFDFGTGRSESAPHLGHSRLSPFRVDAARDETLAGNFQWLKPLRLARFRSMMPFYFPATIGSVTRANRGAMSNLRILALTAAGEEELIR
jgi:hypothetical protein